MTRNQQLEQCLTELITASHAYSNAVDAPYDAAHRRAARMRLDQAQQAHRVALEAEAAALAVGQTSARWRCVLQGGTK